MVRRDCLAASGAGDGERTETARRDVAERRRGIGEIEIEIAAVHLVHGVERTAVIDALYVNADGVLVELGCNDPGIGGSAVERVTFLLLQGLGEVCDRADRIFRHDHQYE